MNVDLEDLKDYFRNLRDYDIYKPMDIVRIIDIFDEESQKLDDGVHISVLYDIVNKRLLESPSKGDIKIFEDLISSVYWQKAKAKSEEFAHEYTLKKWIPDKIGDFWYAVEFIRKYGYREMFRGHEITYFDFKNYKYWTMGAPMKETTLINRAMIKNPQTTLF